MLKPNISIYGQNTSTVVNRFTYLGSILSQTINSDDEINVRIKILAFLRQITCQHLEQKRHWSSMKLKMHRVIFLHTLFHSHEKWRAYWHHTKKQNHFHAFCLRKLLNISWQDRILDNGVLARAGLPRIHNILL